jgi:hypothetical protein
MAQALAAAVPASLMPLVEELTRVVDELQTLVNGDHSAQ